MKQRDILLVPFPFSDQSGIKVRPVLVVSNDEFNKSEDLIVCATTSNVKITKYSIPISQKNLENGFLYDECAIKVENILKIKKNLIIKTIGKLDRASFAKVNKTLLELW